MLEEKWLRLRHQVKCLTGRRPRRVFFLHIPKCGGTSVHRHFKSNFGNGRSGQIALLDSMSGAINDASQMQAARNAQYVSGHCGWNAVEAAGDAFRFTIVREPFARLKSLYLFSRARTTSTHRVFAKMFAVAKTLDFGDFCLTEDLELRALIDNAQARTLAHDYYPFRVQDPNILVRNAVTNLQTLDFVADARDLDDAFGALAAQTETHLLRNQPHLNRTPRTSGVGMSREEFESDRRLFARIAQDCEIYEHALGLVRPAEQTEPARAYAA